MESCSRVASDGAKIDSNPTPDAGDGPRPEKQAIYDVPDSN